MYRDDLIPYTEAGIRQGGIITPPLLANIALSALDEHLMRPWKPGGTMLESTRFFTPFDVLAG